jgi:coenzyme F420 hydrogenase subunit beta
MKAIETVLHLRREHPARIASMVPKHIWPLVEPYDLKPQSTELFTVRFNHNPTLDKAK